MKKILLSVIIILFITSCNAQTNKSSEVKIIENEYSETNNSNIDELKTIAKEKSKKYFDGKIKIFSFLKKNENLYWGIWNFKKGKKRYVFKSNLTFTKIQMKEFPKKNGSILSFSENDDFK